MWIWIFFGGLALTIAHAVYFSRRVTRALGEVAPGMAPALPWLRRAWLVVGASTPVLTLGYVVYVLIADPESFGAPEGAWFTYLFLYPFWFSQILSFQCTLLILPTDGLHWIARKCGALRGPVWARRKNAAVLGLLAFFAVYMPIRMVLDRGGLVVREFELAGPEVPPELDGYRVVLLSDPQADHQTDAERLAEVTAAVNDLDADLVLVAGDIITRDPSHIGAAAKALGRMKAREGVWACIGDHDNFAYSDRDRSLREVRDGLAAEGVPMLDNEVRIFGPSGGELAVVFATHNYVNRIDPGTVAGLLDRVAETDLQIVFAHQTEPRLLRSAREHGAELFLSGHTHGGQVNFWLPFVEAPFVRVETPYVTGRFELGTMSLIVSSGIGMSVAPFRYRAPATVELIRLKHVP